MSQRSWRRIVDGVAAEFGATVSLTGGSGCAAVYCGGSPTSENRETKNLHAALRRAASGRKP